MQFVDHVHIAIESGPGGDGAVAWRREKFEPNGGPAGGDGGKGGDVTIQATEELHTLLDFKYQSQFKAQPGERGRSKNQHGKSGKNLVIKVPCGTIVKDLETGLAIGDLTQAGQSIMVAAGGRGGRGNSRFISSRRQAPQFAEPGEPSIARDLSLELKLIAEVGIIGLPNAGKSTLISVISSAKPKIADYPFTTLAPNLGVVRRPSGDGVLVADIPGLIEGASDGIGLGHEFLRHVERTRLLLHLIDISSLDENEIINTYRIIQTELERYSQALFEKPQLIVLTKTDVIGDDDIVNELKTTIEKESKQPVLTISSIAHQGTDTLVHHMFKKLDTIPPIDTFIDIAPDPKAFNNDDSHFEVIPTDEGFEVIGGKLDRLVRVTDFRNHTAVQRLSNIFNAMGVYKALAKAGAKKGYTITISGQSFDYIPDDTSPYIESSPHPAN